MNKEAYYRSIAEVVASRSKCLSRKIGAVLVKDDSIISTGYNGPPRGIPHCGSERLAYDNTLKTALFEWPKTSGVMCPRRVLGAESGERLDICPATHAEANAIVQAAKTGVSTEGSTMYLTCEVPCKSCLGLIINAGIKKVVYNTRILCDGKPEMFYDDVSRFIVDNSDLEVTTYETSCFKSPLEGR